MVNSANPPQRSRDDVGPQLPLQSLQHGNRQGPGAFTAADLITHDERLRCKHGWSMVICGDLWFMVIYKLMIHGDLRKYMAKFVVNKWKQYP